MNGRVLVQSGIAVTGEATTDVRYVGGGRSRRTAVDVRITTSAGEEVEVTVESVPDDIRRGDAIDVVYDPDDPGNVVAAGQEWDLAALLSFVAVVCIAGAAFQWWVWLKGKPSTSRRLRHRRTPPPQKSGSSHEADERRRRRRRRKRRQRRNR